MQPELYKNEPWQLNSRQLRNTVVFVDKMPFVTAAGVQVNFPFDAYPCQVTYMEKVVTCLKEVTYETVIKRHFCEGKIAPSLVHLNLWTYSKTSLTRTSGDRPKMSELTEVRVIRKLKKLNQKSRFCHIEFIVCFDRA